MYGNGYTIVTDKAFVLQTKPIGEADRLIVLFSNKLGKITVYAKSIRLCKSKLKSFAYPYRYGMFSIIVGKRYILKDARGFDYVYDIWDDQRRYSIFVSILRIIDSLITNTEKNVKIFYRIEEAVKYLQTTEPEPLAIQKPHILRAFKFLVLHELGFGNRDDIQIMSLRQLVSEIEKNTTVGRYIEKQLAMDCI